jgi:hypothetical protein
MLLDTCTIRHLLYVTDLFQNERGLDENSAGVLVSRFGASFGRELAALADLLTMFSDNGPPWAVSETSLAELGRVGGDKGLRLRRSWSDWSHYWSGWADDVPDLINHSGLMWPRIAVSEDQLTLFELPATMPSRVEPRGVLADAGDCALVRDAMRAGVPAILTTDLRSFWRNRRALYGYGLEVWRPSDAWAAYGGTPISAAA